MVDEIASDALRGVLADAQGRGFLGAAPVERAIEHALGFATAADSVPTLAADLGSGGGVPGLVLALAWPESRWSLVEARVRACVWLRGAVDALGLGGRVTVVEGRAEAVGREADHRGHYGLVVARGFGPPAVVAECAAPLLRTGGALVVSDPPGGDPQRWPVEGLALLGLRPEATVTGDASYQRLRQVEPAGERYPRRPGIPAKRPLF